MSGFLGYITVRGKTCCAISLYSFLTLILFGGSLVIGGLIMAVTVAGNF